MKKLFLSLVALVSATMSFAQSSLIATLSHDGEISTFYGASALREAHEAAQHGDIITLSSGSFTSVNITKAVTIRGAGMQVDTIAKTNPTVITGTFDIEIPDSIEQKLTIEGLFHNDEIRVFKLKNATFLKNRLKTINCPSWKSEASIKNSTFIHCKIASRINIETAGSATFVNSYLNDWTNGYSSFFEFTNCIIRFTVAGGYGTDVDLSIRNSSFNNCILYNAMTSGYVGRLEKSCAAYYCVGKNNKNSMFSQIDNSETNYDLISEIGSIFNSYDGSYTDEETFELTDEAKKKYLGSDGTEVGIYGGALPFDPTPTNPQITKCNVASKSTADGKLSVDIEVSAAE